MTDDSTTDTLTEDPPADAPAADAAAIEPAPAPTVPFWHRPNVERYLLPLVLPIVVVLGLVVFVLNLSRVFLSAHGHIPVVVGTVISDRDPGRCDAAVERVALALVVDRLDDGALRRC